MVMKLRRSAIVVAILAAMAAPASGRGLNPGLPDIGAHACFSASSARWATQTDEGGIVAVARIVPSCGTGFGLCYSFVNDTLTDGSRAGTILDVGLATRHLRGDLLGDDSTRDALLGTSKKNFVGLEIGLNMQYDTLQGGLTYYYMSGAIDRFTRGQVVGGFSIQADLNVGHLPG